MSLSQYNQWRRAKITHFPVRVSVRLHLQQLNYVDDLLDAYPDLYENFSHVVRCAVNHLRNCKMAQQDVKNVKGKRKHLTLKSVNLAQELDLPKRRR